MALGVDDVVGEGVEVAVSKDTIVGDMDGVAVAVCEAVGLCGAGGDCVVVGVKVGFEVGVRVTLNEVCVAVMVRAADTLMVGVAVAVVEPTGVAVPDEAEVALCVGALVAVIVGVLVMN